MGGRSGVSDHLEVGDGARLAGDSAVFKPVEAGKTVAGSPAIDAGAWMRQQALLTRLPDLRKRLRRVEKKLADLADDGAEQT
jgi:UDP-3-O-[3-hydroxymyristoyl] glucosamine N-acyltransferase